MKTFYTITRALTEDDKQPPQAKTIIETVIAKVGVGNPIDRKDLVAELQESGALNTRQDVNRVVAFYQPRLTEAGLLGVTKESESSDGEEEATAGKKGKGKKKGKASAGGANEDAAAA